MTWHPVPYNGVRKMESITTTTSLAHFPQVLSLLTSLVGSLFPHFSKWDNHTLTLLVEKVTLTVMCSLASKWKKKNPSFFMIYSAFHRPLCFENRKKKIPQARKYNWEVPRRNTEYFCNTESSHSLSYLPQIYRQVCAWGHVCVYMCVCVPVYI